MGLGSAASVPLADAQGLNPIDERKRDGGIPKRSGEAGAGARRRLPQDDRRVTPAILPCAGSQ
jgi:hypothetical protein